MAQNLMLARYTPVDSASPISSGAQSFINNGADSRFKAQPPADAPSPSWKDTMASYPPGPVTTFQPVNVPPAASTPTSIAGGPLDPGANVRSDIASEYNRGAAVSPAAGVGLAAREALVSPVSRVGGALADAGKAALNFAGRVASPIADAARAFVSGTPPAPDVATAAVPAPAAPQGIISGSMGPVSPVVPATAPVTPTAPGATLPVAPNGPQRRVTINYVGDQQPAAPDPTAQILALQNNGTWSGMLNAKTLAKRLDADRAAKVAAQNADTLRMEANQRASSASATNAKTAAETGLIEQNAQAAQYTQQQKQQIDAMTREMADPATPPARRKLLEQQLVAIHGRNPTQPQVHATPIFDATGQKVGERLNERQADGSWKDVTPKVALKDNPQAMAVVADQKLSDSDKRAKLQAMGYQ